VGVGCQRHPEVSTVGSQLQDGDYTNGWQSHTDHQWKVEGEKEGREKTTKHSTQNALSSRDTGKNALQP